jgi:SAM-dependent methyltransferase
MNSKDNYCQNYQNLTFEDKLRKYRMKFILDYLDNITSNKILEIGCGNDPIFYCYDDYAVMDIVEPENNFYEFVKNKITDNSKVSIHNCFIEDPSLVLKNDYDIIVIGGFLHEIDNPINVLESIKKFANPETIIITYVPNANSFHRLLAFEAGLIKSNYEFSPNDILFGRTNVFNLETIGSLFIDSGFTIVEKTTYFIKPFTHEQMDTLLGSHFFNNQLLKGLFKMTKYMPDMGSEIFVAAKVNT